MIAGGGGGGTPCSSMGFAPNHGYSQPSSPLEGGIAPLNFFDPP